MGDRQVSFVGLEPLPLNEPVIDFVAEDGHVLDLHNGGNVVGIEIEMPSDLVVRLTYVDPARWAPGVAAEQKIQLRFGGVRNLEVVQDREHADEASRTFEDLTAWHGSPGFQVRTGNLELRFDAASLSLKHQPIR